MRKLFFAIVAALFVGTSAMAQQSALSPQPHQAEWGGTAFDGTATYQLQGEAWADSDAVNSLRKGVTVGTSGSVTILLGEADDAAMAEYASKVPQKAEGYYLSIKGKKIVVCGRDGEGTFYGVQTLLQLLKPARTAQDAVRECEIMDYPSVSPRGVIEGFYGNPWSQKDRIRQFQFYGANKMNTYIYGPKDDPYHRSNWKQPYPDKEAGLLKELVKEAHANKVRFVWAIHPGNSIKWTDSDGDGTPDDFVAVRDKLLSVYNLGVREFAVFFDDISGEGTNAVNQARLMNYLTEQLSAAHSDIKPLIICPTQYNRGWSSGNYLTTLGTQMDKSVRIMWTGNSVVDMINRSDMVWINNQIKRKAYIWLNYPVTDYCINHMLMGPTYGNDLDIDTLVSGFTANPMEYAEASKVSLFSIADYTWAMSLYDSNASWQRAIRYLWPAQEEAFRIFCRNNVDLGWTAHGLRRDGESPEFAPIIAKYKSAYDKALFDSLDVHLDSLIWAANQLMTDSTQPEMQEELIPWFRVMRCVGERGRLLVDMERCMQANPIDSVGFIDAYLRLDSVYTLQKSILSRNFKGSVKSPNPVVANEVLAPFLTKLQGELESAYRKQSTYRLDLLPAIQIPEGRYHVRYNGAYLTNVSGSSNPTFVANEDVVNPARQEWNFTLDAETERYKMVSAQDARYVNELGDFGTNSYLSVWNTYVVSMFCGKYAFRNAGSAGKAYWKVANQRISKGDEAWSYDNYVFDLEPLQGETDSSTFVLDEPVYIMYKGQYLTAPTAKMTAITFKDKMTSDPNKRQQWIFSKETQTKRIKLVNAGNKWYVNEKGVFGQNAYYPTWNSYAVTERGGLFNIQNQGEAGTNLWSVTSDGALTQDGSLGWDDSYLFEIKPVSETTGITTLTPARRANNDAYSLDGRLLRRSVDGEDVLAGLQPGIYIVNGEKKVVR